MKKLVRFAIPSLLLASTLAAVASSGPIDVSAGTAAFGSTPAFDGTYRFTDSFTFSVTVPSYSRILISSVWDPIYDLDILSGALVGPSGTFPIFQTSGDVLETWVMPPANLTAGNYTLTVTGYNSPNRGSYSGTISVIAGAAPAIPEASTVAAMLGGLGFLGFVGARRRVALRSQASDPALTAVQSAHVV